MEKQSKRMMERRRLLMLVGGGIAFASVASLAGCSDSGSEPEAKKSSPNPEASKPAAKAEPAAEPAAAPAPAPAQDPAPEAVKGESAPHLAEDDPQAQALGYRNDTSLVDSTRYPQHSAEQACSKCALYSGNAGDAWGMCGIFMGKQVNANGWCSAFAPKA
jgi:hypothetical protein